MRSIRLIAAVAAATLALAPALAAAQQDGTTRGSRHHGKASRQAAGASMDNMADQLNAQSLAQAQAGRNPLGGGPDTTSNLNRMSDQDAMRGRAMPQPAMPFR